MSIVRASTIVGQLTLWGILILKRFPYAIPLMMPLLGTNILFNIFMQQQHTRVCEFLPSEDCARIDSAVDETTDWSFLVDAFKQPAMMARSPMEIPGNDSHWTASEASSSRSQSPNRQSTSLNFV